jgi:hypothetical protein
MKRNAVFWIISVLLLIAQGCATVPKGSDRLAQQAGTFSPPPGKANVYVFRAEAFMGSAVIWPISLDFKEFGTLGLKSYLYGTVLPGDHFLGSFLGQSPSRIKFTAEAGKNYFFEAVLGIGMVVAKIEIEAIDEERGRRYVKEFTLSGDNVFEFLDPSTTAPPK